MSPVSHFLAGWIIANSYRLNRRDRALVTFAGVIPDVDGLGLIAEELTRGWEHPLAWFSDYHHVLGHNIAAAIIVTMAAVMLATRRSIIAVLAVASFHLHLLCDLAGSRGPDGYQWPIIYLFPFSRRCALAWTGQWELNAWPNFVITSLLLLAVVYLAWRRGYSPVEIFSPSGDRAVVTVLRQRFGPPV
ncbi:MAG TPA: metal-dependent hydrolase [Blastocatellia bacterium]|nr:metal-dependent hydrolase [Blastocatellia bacterium]